MTIFCVTCQSERPAKKLYGPAPGKARGLCWYNVCSICHRHYPAPPPMVERMRRRSYRRASGQQELSL